MHTILLGSKSPRRQDLLKGAGIPFVLINIDSDEDFDDKMEKLEVAEYLAIKKSKAYTGSLENSILITADTTVLIDNEIINKPDNQKDAYQMLEKLSGHMHQVLTGVCLRTDSEIISFTDTTNVYFNELSGDQIDYYIKNFQPFDKAGAYGIQDWIGYIGVRKIEGDFFNVMGLPIQRVFSELQKLTTLRL